MEIHVHPLVGLVFLLVGLVFLMGYWFFLTSEGRRGYLIAMLIVVIVEAHMFAIGYVRWHFSKSLVDAVVEQVGFLFFFIFPYVVHRLTYLPDPPRARANEP